MSSTTASVSPLKPAPARIDPLAEFNRPAAKPLDLRHAGRAFGATVLVAAGLALSGWLVYLVHSAVFRPERLGSLTRLVPPDAADRVLTIPAGKVELPAAGLTVVAYVLVVVLAGISTKVAVALVKEGTSLLRQATTRDPQGGAADATSAQRTGA